MSYKVKTKLIIPEWMFQDWAPYKSTKDYLKDTQDDINPGGLVYEITITKKFKVQAPEYKLKEVA